MAESKLRALSVQFAVGIVRFCEGVKGHRSLADQLERAATSIGANIHEANYAHSKADFIAKLQIALKECYETEYWLEVFAKAALVDENTTNALVSQCGKLRRMLISSLTTAKANEKAE